MNKFALVLVTCIGFLATAYGALAGDRNEFAIMWIGEIKEDVEPSQADVLISKIAEVVSDNNGTLAFEISRVGGQLFGYERFSDLEGLIAQMELVGPFFPQIGAIWSTVTVVPTTEVPVEVSELLKGYNALVPDSFARASR